MAFAEDQALAHDAAVAMADLAVGLVSINDSYARKMWSRSEAKRYDAIAKSLKDDFAISFRRGGTYAEALDELGNVVAEPCDSHAWWMVNGIVTSNNRVDRSKAAARLLEGDGRGAHQALGVLTLLQDLKIEPCVPDRAFYIGGRLPKGVDRVVVDGLEVESSALRVSVQEDRSSRSVHMGASRGWTSLLTIDTAARSVSDLNIEVVQVRPSGAAPVQRQGAEAPVPTL